MELSQVKEGIKGGEGVRGKRGCWEGSRRGLKGGVVELTLGGVAEEQWDEKA